MAYSDVGIANLALGKIGVKPISAFYPSETTPQAISVYTAWAFTRDMVLEAEDWVFATRRQRLAKLTIAVALSDHLYGYAYAYAWPTDALRVCHSRPTDPSSYPSQTDYSYAYMNDEYISALQRVYPYTVETLNDGRVVILTNFDNSSYPLFGRFVFRIVDPAKFSATFVEAFACLLAAQIAITRTETAAKKEAMLKDHGIALTKAKELNQRMSFHDDAGDDSWVTAGR